MKARPFKVATGAACTSLLEDGVSEEFVTVFADAFCKRCWERFGERPMDLSRFGLNKILSDAAIERAIRAMTAR